MTENPTPYSGLVTPSGLRLMERCGWTMFAAWLATLVVWGLAAPDPYAKGGVLVAELMVVGRAVSIYEGVRMGFSKLYLLIQAGPQDVILLLVGLPWVIRIYERAARGRLIDRVLRRVTRAAEEHQHKVRRFGAVGLFFFVFFPVSSTGTLVGGVVGYLLGMPIRLLLTFVFLGHFASIAVLMLFFDWLEPVLLSMDAGFAKYFAWILLASLFLLGWLYGLLKSRMGKKARSTPADAVQEPDIGVNTPK